MHSAACRHRTNRSFKPIPPPDVVFLRTVAPASPHPLPGATDVFFDILASDDQFSFDVQKRSHQGMIMGKMRDSHLKPDFLQQIYLTTVIFIDLHLCVCPYSGVVRQVKPIIGSRDSSIVLEVAMNYVKSGVISHRNIVVIHVFISEFWFWSGPRSNSWRRISGMTEKPGKFFSFSVLISGGATFITLGIWEHFCCWSRCIRDEINHWIWFFCNMHWKQFQTLSPNYYLRN